MYIIGTHTTPVKGKGKVVRMHARKARGTYRVGTATRIIKRRHKRNVIIQLHIPSASLEVKSPPPQPYLNGRLVGLQSRSDCFEKRKSLACVWNQTIIPQFSSL
jgi:hypothetical protein